jgi:hypothetical protein
MKVWIGIAALVGMLASGGAMAEDGNQLLQQCQSAVRGLDNISKPSDQGVDIGHCFGMVNGIKATMMYHYPMLPQAYKTCFPDGGVSDAQGTRVVTKYLQDNPAQLHEEATFLTILAFMKAYPCSK